MQHSVDHQVVPRLLKRSKTWVAMALCLALPTGAQALGVGQLQVRSALNQPLHAELELLEVRPGDLGSLQVRIATQALGGLGPPADRFDHRIESRDGRHILRLTSSQPIREPLLNFLVELNWDQGRLLREVAIFLDPPTAPTRPATQTAATSPAPVRQATPQPAAPPPSSSPPATAAINIDDGFAYGPVQRGETLWAIAQRTRPGENVAMQQMMQAIFQANPRAFMRSNMDALMAGVTLQIPAVDGHPPRVATPPTPAPRTTPPTPDSAPRPEPEVQPQPEPPPAPPPEPEPAAEPAPRVEAEPTVSADEVQIRLVPPSEAVATRPAPPPVPRLRQEGEPFRLQLAGLDSLRQRVQTLQQQRPELLIAQTEPEIEPIAVVEPPVEPPATPAIEPEATVAEPDPSVAVPAEAVEISPTPAAESIESDPLVLETPDIVDTTPTVTTEMLEPVPSVGEQPDVTISEPEPVVAIQTEPTEPPRVADADAAEPAPEQQPVTPPAADITTVFQQLQDDPIGTLNQLRRDPLMLASAGGGLVALLLLLWLVVRFKRRGEEEAGVYDELLADETTPTESGIAKRQPADKKSDTKPVIDETPTREQPLKRINFLIAGGSYREAENALRLLMVDQADDPELQLKLLEIYYRSGDTEKFVETAETLQQQLGDAPDHPLWQSAVRMGNELSPGHPLFNQADDADALVFNALESSAERAATPSSVPTEATQAQGHSPRLVFPGEPHPESAGEQQTDVTQVPQPQSTQNDARQPAASETESDDTMVFAKPQPLRFTQDTDERRSVDKPSTPTSDQSASQDDFDAYFASEQPSVSDSELTLDDLPELDAGIDADQQEAIEIKLDLAQAYLDMDDQAGAKALLEEVQHEGNVVQQERAQAILRRLS